LWVSWNKARPIAERGLKPKKKPQPKPIEVGEKTAGWGHDHVSVVCDSERAMVEYEGDKRKKKSREGYFSSISEMQS